MTCDHCGATIQIDAVFRAYGHRFCNENCAYSYYEDARDD